MRIKEVEELVGITRKNIRFYEKEGLLTPGRDSENSYRDYCEADILRLKQIKLLRRLNMPLGEIGELFEGSGDLTRSILRHADALEKQRSNIETSLSLCRMLGDEQTQLNKLDVDEYLSKIEALEREGAVFMDVKKTDVRKKYIAPVIVCVLMVVVSAIAMVGFWNLHRAEPAPFIMILLLMFLLAATAVGIIIALVARIKEIKGGEENDLSQY